jgi:GH24 family phage-related lysozyme (muramidase)
MTGGINALSKTYPTLAKLTPGVFLQQEEDMSTVPPEGIPPGGTTLRPHRGIRLRKVYDKGVALTKDSEGFVATLYNDSAGYCSIAFGHLVKRAGCDGTEPDEFQRGLSEPRGAEILVDDMSVAERNVIRNVTVDLSDGQYAALCDFVYNVGGGNFQRSTLLNLVNAKQHDRVSDEFRLWVVAGGKQLPGLITRREKEIVLYFEGLPRPHRLPPSRERLPPSGERLPPSGERRSLIDIRTGER